MAIIIHWRRCWANAAHRPNTTLSWWANGWTAIPICIYNHGWYACVCCWRRCRRTAGSLDVIRAKWKGRVNELAVGALRHHRHTRHARRHRIVIVYEFSVVFILYRGIRRCKGAANRCLLGARSIGIAAIKQTICTTAHLHMRHDAARSKLPIRNRRCVVSIDMSTASNNSRRRRAIGDKRDRA